MAESEYILKVDSTGFADGLMGSVKGRGTKVFPISLAISRRRLPWTKLRKI